MNELVVILGLALLPAAGNFLGGILAEVSRPSPKAVSLALHAAVGLVFAIISTELLPEASEVLSGWLIGIAFIIGGLLYVGADSIASRLSSGGGGGSKRMWLIYAAVMVDLASDGIVIGSSGAVAVGLALKLALGQILADLPEGYATASALQSNNVPRGKRILMMASFAIPVLAAAAFTHLVLKDAGEAWRFGALAAISGLLALAAIEDMLGEAHENSADSKPAAIAFVSGFALFVFVSAGLDQWTS
jgi:ZIP family zinc transporter